MSDMIKKLQASPEIRGTLCVGGFFGWYLSVMFICEKSLQIYGTSSFFTMTNIIFGVSCLATLAVILFITSHFDFEGLLNHRYFRAVPGILMAESGAALVFTNADSFGAYAAIIGMCAAFGSVAVVTSLLGVKVGKRMTVVASGIAMAGGIRMINEIIYANTDMTRGIYVLTVLSGILALLTVRSHGFSREEMPIISYSEVSAKVLLRDTPYTFVLFFGVCAFYFISKLRAESIGFSLYSPTMSGYEMFFFISFVFVSVIIACFAKFHSISPIFALAICTSCYSSIMLYLPYFSRVEESFYLIFSLAGQACFYIFAFIFIVTFAMDLRYPLFYAVGGFAVFIAAQLSAHIVNYIFPSYGKTGIIVCMAILLFVGSPTIYLALKRHGLTHESFEHRRLLRSAIENTYAEMELTERERYLIELVVLYGYTAEQLPDKMMLSRNTVKAQGRNLLQKLGLEDISELHGYFENIIGIR